MCYRNKSLHNCEGVIFQKETSKRHHQTLRGPCVSGRVDAHRGIRHRRSQAGGHCDEELLEKSMEAVVFA